MVEKKLQEFKQEECEVLAISTGSIVSKVAFLSVGREEGGVSGISFGLVEDRDGGDRQHVWGDEGGEWVLLQGYGPH